MEEWKNRYHARSGHALDFWIALSERATTCLQSSISLFRHPVGGE